MNKIHLISNSRSGSSYLYSVITKYHPYDLKISEPFGNSRFNESKITSKELFLNSQVRRISGSYQTILKNHTYHLDLLYESGLWETFKINSFHNVVLYRKNIFESSLSLALAFETGKWSSYEDYPQKQEVDENRFKDCVAQQYLGLLWFVKNDRHISFDRVISYEELSYKPLTDYNQLLIGQADKETESIRQKAPNKSDIVTNYETLQAICYDECVKRNLLTFDDFVLQDPIS
jgi:hypothetical protein